MKEGLLDWDCAESLNIPDMEKALSHIRSQGTFPVSSLSVRNESVAEFVAAPLISHPEYTKPLAYQRLSSLFSLV